MRNERIDSCRHCSNGRRSGDCCRVVLFGSDSPIGQILHFCHTVLLSGAFHVDNKAKPSVHDELLGNKHMLLREKSCEGVEPIESGREWRL